MSKILSFFVVFALSFSLFSTEKLPVLIGRLDVPSLMSVTEELSRITETISPGSSIMLVMGLTALSFDPKMKDFDLTSNISLCLYAFEKNNAQAVEWCAVFNKKIAGEVDKTNFGKNLFCKEFGARAAIADSKELLDKLTDLPPSAAKTANSDSDEDDEDSGISLSLKPELYLKNYNADYASMRNDFLRQLSMRYQKDGDAGLIRSKAARVRMEYIEKFLAQVSDVKMNIRIKKDGIVLKLNLQPAANSQFADFIAIQKNSKPVLLPFARDKKFVASGSFTISPSFRKSASDMFRDIAFELAEDEKNNTYTEIVDLIAKNASGSFSLFSDISQNKKWSDAVIKIQTSKDAVAKLNSIFAQKYTSAKTGLENFYKISELSFAEAKSLKTFCLLSDSSILVYEGEALAESAMKIAGDGFKNTDPVDDEYSGCAFVLKSSSSESSHSDEVISSFKDNSAALRVFISSTTIKGFIPPEYLSKKKKSKK